MQNRKHYAAGFLAFTIWGFFSIPLRAIADHTAGQILFFRILFSLVVIVFVIAVSRKKELAQDFLKFKSLDHKGKRLALVLTAVGAVLLTLNWLTFIYVVNYVNVKTASFAYLVCPVITAVLGYVLLKERLTQIQWLSVLLCSVSCLMVGLSSRTELGFSLLTASTYALYLISQRKNQGFDRMVGLGIQVLISFAILCFVYPFLVPSIPTAPKFYWTITMIAVIFTVLPLYLNLYALNKINSATIGIMMYLNPLFNFSIAFIFFDEKVTTLQLVAYTIILVALGMFNYQSFRKLQGKLMPSKAN
jgi:chloramphenicol-sensitive protein RarD